MNQKVVQAVDADGYYYHLHLECGHTAIRALYRWYWSPATMREEPTPEPETWFCQDCANETRELARRLLRAAAPPENNPP